MTLPILNRPAVRLLPILCNLAADHHGMILTWRSRTAEATLACSRACQMGPSPPALPNGSRLSLMLPEKITGSCNKRHIPTIMSAGICLLCQHQLGQQISEEPVHSLRENPCTRHYGSTAKVLAKCMLKYYRISECLASGPGTSPLGRCQWRACAYKTSQAERLTCQYTTFRDDCCHC